MKKESNPGPPITIHPFAFQLEESVKDRITGFEGIILGRTQYSTGCNQYGVLPTKLNKDGELRAWKWFDGSRLISIGKPKEPVNTRGGPHPKAPDIN